MPKNKSQARSPIVNSNRSGRRYAKIAEAATYLDVNPATIRVMISDGRLTGYWLGPRILRVDLNQIDAVMGPSKAIS